MSPGAAARAAVDRFAERAGVPAVLPVPRWGVAHSLVTLA